MMMMVMMKMMIFSFVGPRRTVAISGPCSMSFWYKKNNGRLSINVVETHQIPKHIHIDLYDPN